MRESDDGDGQREHDDDRCAEAGAAGDAVVLCMHLNGVTTTAVGAGAGTVVVVVVVVTRGRTSTHRDRSGGGLARVAEADGGGDVEVGERVDGEAAGAHAHDVLVD